MLIYFTALFLLFQGYETQRYDVIERIGEVEIRFYPPVMKVKTVGAIASNKNFTTLFQYISGNNDEQEKIAMTTPVYLYTQDNSEIMEFVLPSKYMDTAPEALATNAEVYQSSSGHYAAIRFGGYSSAAKEKVYTKKLLNVLAKAGEQIIGDPQRLSYDAPYKFYKRRNEIVVEIKK